MSIVSVEEIKYLLDIPQSDTERDADIQFLINSAEQIVENYIEYPLQEKIIIEERKGTNTSLLSLKYYPINSLIYVYEKELDNSNSVDITDKINFSLYKNNGIILRADKSLFLTNKIYEVSYKAGFIQVPNDIKYAVRLLTLSLNSQHHNVKDGVSRVGTPDGTIWYNQEILTPAITSILDKYRKVSLK